MHRIETITRNELGPDLLLQHNFLMQLFQGFAKFLVVELLEGMRMPQMLIKLQVANEMVYYVALICFNYALCMAYSKIFPLSSKTLLITVFDVWQQVIYIISTDPSHQQGEGARENYRSSPGHHQLLPSFARPGCCIWSFLTASESNVRQRQPPVEWPRPAFNPIVFGTDGPMVLEARLLHSELVSYSFRKQRWAPPAVCRMTPSGQACLSLWP